MDIIVLNCGSSSLKFQLIETDSLKIASDSDIVKAKGLVERIGSEALITLSSNNKPAQKFAKPIKDHRIAINFVLDWCMSAEAGINGIKSIKDINAIGHRVAHGGEFFSSSAVITENVLKGIQDCIDLAPLHNPANLSGIKAAMDIFGMDIPQTAVFDTAYHTTMPETSYLYALPYQLYSRHKIRRYGFHGTSHKYVAMRYAQIHNKKLEEVNIITLHLGNGASACAIKNGKSIDTSMGMTPVEGLVMGTRCGDIDPALIDIIAHKEGMNVHEVTNLLNKHSGLIGISGLTNDMRELVYEAEEKNDRRARLAIDLFSLRIKKYIGAYLAEMGGAEAIVFTGGIGENSSPTRRRVCSDLDFLGLYLDEAQNIKAMQGYEGTISTPNSTLKAYVIPTNEELMIARDTYNCVYSLNNK